LLVRVAVAVLAVLAAILGVFAAASATSSQAAPEPALPEPVPPAFIIPEPELLATSRDVAQWATVARGVPVHAHADSASSVVASLATRTPEGTTNVVSVVGGARDQAGELWMAVRVPALPSNITGWVLRGALGGYTFVHTHLVVDLERRSAELLLAGRTIFRARIGIGKSSSPTPTGEYYVRSKIWSLRSPFYGPLAFGTSARSRTLTDWPGGGFVGIHGTNQPRLIPGSVSHGCIRMRNDDILELGRLMPVGTPLTIR
jgi:hypothetical protein